MAYLNYPGLAYFKSLLDQTYLRVGYDGDTTIAGHVTFTNPITGDIDGRAKKDWLGQQLDTTYLKDIQPDASGALKLILGNGQVSHLITDTTVTQERSSANETYPVLLCYDENATANQIAKKVKYGHDVQINPAYGYIYAQGYVEKHRAYNRTIAQSTRAEWMLDFRDSVLNPVGQIYSYVDPSNQGGEHRMELRLYGNPYTTSLNLPNYNFETDTVSLGVSSTKGDKLTFFGYAPSTPIYLENGSTMRKSTVRGDQYGRDIITRDWLNLNGSITGLVHTYMDETIDGYKTFLKTVTIDSGNDNAKAGLNVQGDVNIDSGDSTKPSNLYVQGNSHIHGNEDIDGNLNVDGTSTLDGNVHMKHNLDVDGNLNVDGTSDQHGNVHMYSNLDVDGNANTDGNQTIGGTLTVTGNISTANGNISTTNGTVSGKTGSIGTGGLTVTGPSNLNGKVTAGSGLEVTGNTKTTTLTVTSGATVGTTLGVGGKATISGGLAVTSGTTTDTLTVTSGATVSGGATIATGNLTVTSGGVTASNGTGTFKNLSVTSNGTFGGTVTANTANIGSGGLTVTGPSNLNGGTTTTTLTASTINATSANIKNLKITSGGSIVNNEGDEYVTTVINNNKTTVVSALIAPNGGLQKDSNNQISVKTGDGIQVSSGYVTTRLTTNGGLQYAGSTANAKTISVKTGNGTQLSNGAVIAKLTQNGGLKFDSTGGIYVNFGDPSNDNTKAIIDELRGALGIQIPLDQNLTLYVNKNDNEAVTTWRNNHGAVIKTVGKHATATDETVTKSDGTTETVRCCPFKTISAAVACATQGYSVGSHTITIKVVKADSGNGYNELVSLPQFNHTTGSIIITSNDTSSVSTYAVITNKNTAASGQPSNARPAGGLVNVSGSGWYIDQIKFDSEVTDPQNKISNFPTCVTCGANGAVTIRGCYVKCSHDNNAYTPVDEVTASTFIRMFSASAGGVITLSMLENVQMTIDATKGTSTNFDVFYCERQGQINFIGSNAGASNSAWHTINCIGTCTNFINIKIGSVFSVIGGVKYVTQFGGNIDGNACSISTLSMLTAASSDPPSELDLVSSPADSTSYVSSNWKTSNNG